MLPWQDDSAVASVSDRTSERAPSPNWLRVTANRQLQHVRGGISAAREVKIEVVVVRGGERIFHL